jgi:iron complex outermembrane receptor protein
MFKIIFLSLSLFLIGTAAQSQNCDFTIRGTVNDYHDGKPLQFAQIYVESMQRTFSTDENGKFKIEGLCTGDYTLKVSHIECDPKMVKIVVKGDQEISIFLEHHIEELDKVSVIADVHDNHKTTQSTQFITSRTLQEYSGATLGDALEQVSGVSTLKTGNSVVKPIIHGLYGSRVAIVNNGLRQQDQEWGVEHAPNIDPNAADNIEVVKGASALRYGGDAVGGTIVINPARILAQDTLLGNINLQGQTNGRGGSTSATVSNFRNSGWFQNATVTYRKLGDFEAPDYVLSNTGSETKAVNLRAGFKKFEYGVDLTYSYYQAEIGILRASHIGNVSDLVRGINSGEPAIVEDFTYNINSPKQDVDHHGIQLNAFKRFSQLGKLSFNYGFQYNNRLEFDIRRGANAGRASLDIDLTTHTTAFHLLIDKLDDFTIEAGVDASFQNNAPNPDTNTRRLIPDYNSIKAGGFISAVHSPSDRWIFDAGLRYDIYDIDADKFYLNSRWENLGYDEQFSQFEVGVQGNQILTNPQFQYDLYAITAGAKHIISDHYDFSINLSTANRAPNPSELFSDGLHHALATIELGRLDLEKEQSYKINSVFHMNSGNLDIEVSPHINFINDFIQLEPSGLELTTRGAFPVSQYRQIDARIYGLDVSTFYTFYKSSGNDEKLNSQFNEKTDEVPFKFIEINADFAYIHGTNLDDDVPLIDMPPAQMNLQGIWYDAFAKALQLKIGFQHVWEQNRFPNLDYEVSVINDQGMEERERVRISQPPAAYSLMNFGVGYDLTSSWLGDRTKTKINLTVNNLLNTEYRNYLNRQRFYADDVGRDIQLQVVYRF